MADKKFTFHSVKTRTIAAFLVVVALVIIVATIVTFVMTNQQEHEEDQSTGIAAAKICATVVDFAHGDLADFKPGNTDYDECSDTLRLLCGIEDMVYMYVYTVDLDANTMTYIMAVSSDPKLDKIISQARPFGTTVSMDHLNEHDLAVVSGQSDENVVAFDNDFGHMLDCIVPIGDSGMFAAASYSVTDQNSRIIMSTVSIVAHLIFALLLLLIGQLIVLQCYVMVPLRKISDKMKHFEPSHAHNFESIGITTQDELGKISSAFEGMAKNIADYLDNIEEMTEERVQVNVELDVAHRIQQGMVPASNMIKGDTADIYAFSRSARDVGGDFYDVVKRDDGSIAIVIGDVSGKGVAAALFMAMSKESIRIELSTGKDPASTLTSVNEQLCKHNPESMFVTVLIALMDPDGHVTFANAGHLHPVRILDEALEVGCNAGCLLGLFDDAEIVNETLDLAPGESLLLYTDGACEAVNAKKEFLGEEAIRTHLSARAPFSDVRDVLDELMGAVDGFAAQAEQFDDLTAIAMRRHDQTEVGRKDKSVDSYDLTEMEFNLAAYDEVRDIIMAGTDEIPRLRACLACEEVYANIISYSGATRVYYDVSEQDHVLSVIFEDNGVPFDPLMADPVEKEFEELDSGGMGIALVKEIAKDLSYQRSGGHNKLKMVFDLKDKVEE